MPDIKKKVSFDPFVTVRPYLAILDPVVKEQLYYSKEDLQLIRMEVKRIRWAKKLQQQQNRMAQIEQRYSKDNFCNAVSVNS
mmetsp:Transcript_5800/g.9152  ORF Transcript_5800/g.9152 Transcript_5800/m.9152 type:complete len:82 (-) Transcript_5800:14-259(-)